VDGSSIPPTVATPSSLLNASRTPLVAQPQSVPSGEVRMSTFDPSSSALAGRTSLKSSDLKVRPS